MVKHCQENEEIAENLNNFFADRITNLKLPPYEDPTTNAENIADPVLKAIEKYKNHSSIRIINDSGFTFNQVSLEEIQKGLKNLNPSKLHKVLTDLFAPILHQEINQSLSE